MLENKGGLARSRRRRRAKGIHPTVHVPMVSAPKRVIMAEHAESRAHGAPGLDVCR